MTQQRLHQKCRIIIKNMLLNTKRDKKRILCRIQSQWVQNPDLFCMYMAYLPGANEAVAKGYHARRINREGHYSIGNMCWWDPKTQQPVPGNYHGKNGRTYHDSGAHGLGSTQRT